MPNAAGAHVVDPARRQSVEEAIVEHVLSVLPPSRDALRAVVGRVQALRTEVGPWLATQQAKPWAELAATCWVQDLTPAVQAVAEQLAGVEAAVAEWEAKVRALTPRRAHRHGPFHRRFAREILHQPVQILLAVDKLRKSVEAVEAKVARVGPLAPSPRTSWTPVDPAELRGKESPKAKSAFSPFDLHGAA